MFDLGWLELIVIGITALIVVGPKDLPGLFQTVGRFMGKARGMAREFQRSMEEAANESGVKEAANTIRKVTDPLNEATRAARNYAKSSLDDVMPDGLDEDALGMGEPFEAPEKKPTAKPADPQPKVETKDSADGASKAN